MKAIVLAAGEGSRLKPFTATRPKVMIPVGNKPILEYVINALQESGIIDIILVVGYKREKIMDYFSDGHKWGVNITYVEQYQQLGTAHALRQASHLIKDHFLVINGDTVIDASAIKEIMRYQSGDATMLTVTVDKAQKYGVVQTQNHLVKSIQEKPAHKEAGNTVNAGVYCFSPKIFDFLEFMDISERGDYEITDAIKKMIENGIPVRAVHTNATWMDAAYLWDLIELNAATLARQKAENHGTIEEGAHVIGAVNVGENTTIRSGCYIVGPGEHRRQLRHRPGHGDPAEHQRRQQHDHRAVRAHRQQHPDEQRTGLVVQSSDQYDHRGGHVHRARLHRRVGQYESRGGK